GRRDDVVVRRRAGSRAAEVALDAEVDAALDQRHQLLELAAARLQAGGEEPAGGGEELLAGAEDPTGDARAVEGVERRELIEGEAVEVVVAEEVALLGLEAGHRLAEGGLEFDAVALADQAELGAGDAGADVEERLLVADRR